MFSMQRRVRHDGESAEVAVSLSKAWHFDRSACEVRFDVGRADGARMVAVQWS